MSKIVCDVCGSTYSETETQSPICGTAKSEAAKPVIETSGEDQSGKGGKFSKTSTRKTGSGSSRKPGSENNKAGEGDAPSNLAMIVIVAVLLLAIVAVCVFIFVRLRNQPDPQNPSSSTQSTPQTVPCTGIELVDSAMQSLTFTDLTQTAQLSVKALPENTTDTVVCTYTSNDPAVVTVSETGLVMPVASGNAAITIAYGTHTITVSVTCDIPKPITELKLIKTEITLSPTNGLTVQLYDGELDPADIVWTSTDETVAYVENGLVTAVANGKATITATYGDLTASCKINVSGINAETGYALACTWGVKNDATMVEGEKIKIFLIDKETNQPVTDLEWVPSNDFKNGCASFVVTENGIEVTALKSTANVSGQYVYIQTTYEGEVYRFIIRIKTAEAQE